MPCVPFNFLIFVTSEFLSPKTEEYIYIYIYDLESMA